MRRLGLKYISSTGANFPAVNSGKWNLATNFKGNFNRILTESGIDPEDDESVALYLRFTESGMLLCAARRYFPVSEPMAHFQTLWMFVPDSLIISRESLSKAVRELTGIFDHPEAFTSVEAFEDILPSIFLQDFEEENSREPEPTEEEKAAEEAGKRLEREIFEAFAGMGKEKENNEQPRKKMTGERIGYVGYESVEELEIILSAGFIPQYSNFGLIYLTDYPVRVESLLPGLFHPDILLHRQLERDRQREEEERRRREEEETGKQEDSELTGEEEGNIETGEQEDSGLILEEVGNVEIGEQEDSNTIREEGDAVQTGEQETDVLTGEEVGNGETGEQETSREGEDSHRKTWRKNFSKHSFWAGFIAASVLYLLIYIVVQVCQSL